MRLRFTPTAGGTFFKSLRHTVVERKDSFDFLIKIEWDVFHGGAVPAAGE